MKKTIVLFLAVFFFVAGHTECNAWWFTKSDQESLAEALSSRKPKTVEKCLDRQIRIKNIAGILQIRKHARDMIRSEKNRIHTSRGISPQALKKNIAPWVSIEKKATEFYKVQVR